GSTPGFAGTLIPGLGGRRDLLSSPAPVFFGLGIPKEMFCPTGPVGLGTGGASGIGLAIAKAFVQNGAKVVVGSRTADKVEGAVKEINKLPEVEDDEPHAL